MALFGPPDVEKLSRKRDVRRLVKLLDHEDPTLRGKAARALGEAMDSEHPDASWVMEGLLVAVQEDKHEVAAQALEALLRMGAPLAVLLAKRDRLGYAAVPLLLAVHAEQGELAAEAQRVLTTPRGLELLVRLRDPAIFDVLISAVEPRGRVARRALDALVELGDPRAVEPLIALLDDRSGLAPAVVGALAKLGDARAVKPLIGLVEKRGELASPAIDALARLGDARAIAPLIAVLGEHEDLTLAALNALDRIGDERVVEPLIALLSASDSKVQSRAAQVLGATKDPRAFEPLVDCLLDSTRPRRQEAAAYALGDLGDSRAIEPLRTAARDGSPAAQRLQKAALRSLRHMDAAQVEEARAERGPAPVDAGAPPGSVGTVRTDDIDALDSGDIEKLMDIVLQDSSAVRRMAALEKFISGGEPVEVGVLSEATCRSADPAIRARCVRRFRERGNEARGSYLIKSYLEGRNISPALNAEERMWAAESLSELL